MHSDTVVEIHPGPPPALVKSPEPADVASSPLTAAAAVVAATFGLAACGGGGADDATATTPVTPQPPVNAAPTDEQAARFLGQAGFGATDALLARVKLLGYAGWLEEQFNASQSLSHVDWMTAKGFNASTNINNANGLDNTLWRKLIASPDVLRQRMVLALSEIFVVSIVGLPVSWRGFIGAAYVDVLDNHAFGNYRSLLQAVTLSNAMGVYLNMRGNRKADSSGRVPDENYAREVLQLFSLGLVELNLDGSPKLNNNHTVDTYGQDTITGLARALTGWDYDATSRTEPSFASRPMAPIESRHETGESRFLGTTVAAGTTAVPALRQALDAIANHPNVAPFISRQLIQRLVASNPSAAYVARVAAVFNNNGSGVRGDLKAVLRAVLLDTEARRDPALASTNTADTNTADTNTADTSRGKLREPVVRFVQWARTFGVDSPTDLWNVGNLSDPATRLGQSPLRSPSVFNFFRPGYLPPNSALGTQNITAPEFQITNESSVVGYANFAQTFVASGVGELRPDYSAELALAGDASALVQRVALLLAAGALSASALDIITQAVASIAAASDAGRRNRVYAAVHLVLCAPDYLVQI